MTDLVVLMLISMAMAWCADHVVWKRESVKKGHRMAVFSVAITVLMAGFAGLRTRCNDTGAYKHGYELITEGSLENIDINIGCIVPFLDVIIKDKPDVPGLTLYYLIFLVNTVISYWVSSYKSFCVFTFYTQNYNA